uniref:Uncharacterized protein n=1 Tax=Noccaea caerulescens TaxID=107243 RepID=A0A1J3HDU2_NOCCA
MHLARSRASRSGFVELEFMVGRRRTIGSGNESGGVDRNTGAVDGESGQWSVVAVILKSEIAAVRKKKKR